MLLHMGAVPDYFHSRALWAHTLYAYLHWGNLYTAPP